MAVAAKKRNPSGSASPRNVVAAARRGGSPKPAMRWDWVKSLLGAVVIFLFIRTFLVEAYHIPSGSMVPTLLVGDFLFVNKAVYGAHVPLTDYNLPAFSDPKRGSIAVYRSPDASDGNPTVVKRLVGIPGDTLYMRDGLLYVNGIAQRQGYGAPAEPEQPDFPSPGFDWQKRVALQHSRFGPAPAQPTRDNWGPFVVPPRHYFSLGDNRDDSKDARFYGFVPRENLRGRPIFIYLSIDFDDWRIRWNRIGMLVR
ncbi:MAG TPA: signal peptidase I [Gemmatimonadaceae bacterium]|nr:signal peptidase I [Gemmatimonadaceae bacterium]